jgi:hypothetical protein
MHERRRRRWWWLKRTGRHKEDCSLVGESALFGLPEKVATAAVAALEDDLLDFKSYCAARRHGQPRACGQIFQELHRLLRKVRGGTLNGAGVVDELHGCTTFQMLWHVKRHPSLSGRLSWWWSSADIVQVLSYLVV